MATRFYGAVSLDGFLAQTDHDLSWLLNRGTPDVNTYDDFIANVGAVVMGSSTYEWLLSQVGPDEWPYQQPTWVFTTRKLPVAKGDIRFVRGSVRPVHEQMLAAAGGKDIWVVGGGELVGQFYDEDLLDELIIQVTAVTLGEGLPVLPRTIIDPPLKLTSVTRLGDTFAELRFDVPKPTNDW